MDDHQRAHEALSRIPASLPRDEWIKVGMAAHAAGLDFEDFDNWSATADNYDARAARDVWRSFKSGAISAGTLHYIAAGHGHKSKLNGDHKHQPKATGITVTPRPGQSAIDVWERCEPATWENPYIQRKNAAGVPLDSLRVVPADDKLRIGGNSMAGALVVPAYDAEGALQSLQLIPPEGKKMNLAGCPMAGASHIVGTGDGPLYVVEGIGAAWAAWQATGRRAVVTFGAGNTRRIAEQLRQKEPAATLVLVPDAGKESDADKIAADLNAAVAKLPTDWPANSDVGDFAEREGLEALQSLLEAAEPPAAPKPRYELLRSADLRKLPPLDWRVKGVLPAKGLATIYGASGAGKSFLALDLAAAIAEGGRWFGYRIEPASVVYLALEGEAGIKQRTQAWEASRGRTLPHDCAVVLAPFAVTSAADTSDLAAVVPAGGVVFVDTLNRSAPTADENASKDVGEILQGAKALQAAIDGLVVLIHHSGKDVERGPRGHSSLYAAMDGVIVVERDGDWRSWRAPKVKDGSETQSHGFRLRVEHIGTDKDGDPTTSCVIEAVNDADRPAPGKGKRVGAVEGAVLEYLSSLKTGTRKADVVKHFAGQYEKGPIYRAMVALANAGAIHESAGMVCIAGAAK